MAAFPPDDAAMTSLLVVSDVEASERWYREVLGAEHYRSYGGTSSVLTFAGHWLLLVTGGEPTEDKPATRMAPPADPELVSHAFTIRVPDCRAAYEELRARGAQLITPPFERESEIRCFFRDPDGHLFEISEIRQREGAPGSGEK